jgi:putative tryptophan/tyrosine transport system substrate-binding protein
MEKAMYFKNIGLVVVTSLSVFLASNSSEAQQAVKIPHVAFLAPQGRTLPLLDAFKKGLSDLGYIDGRNIVIEARFADGHYERFPEILAEFSRMKVDVLAVTGAVTARAAKKAVTDIPIVFSIVVDPVPDGVVPNLDRPGGNLTGVTSFDPLQSKKQLELLKEVVPSLKRVAILGDQGVSEALMKAGEEQARAMGLEPQRIRLAGPVPDLDAAFAAIRQQHTEAVLVLEEPVLGVYADQIAKLAAKERLPILFAPSRVSAGGPLNYGTSQVAAIRRMTAYVDKILKGARPGDLPVERVTLYELVVNVKTAREVGVTIPPEVLKRSDQTIQ